jgi:predicted GIY-YIG superfamily endonuclease
MRPQVIRPWSHAALQIGDRSRVPHAYILRCSDGSYYVGSTNALAYRLFEHEQGLGPSYTRERRPVELAWAAEFETVAHAYTFEQQIKKWNRAKKEALIAGDFARLPVLASRSFEARRMREAARALRDGPCRPSSGTHAKDEPGP